jgi:4-carboxymuconolactone decarboxylase
MTRIPEATRDNVPDETRASFDKMLEATKGVMPTGPGAISMNSPEFALRRNPLSNYMRWEMAVPQAIQELAILATARAMDCPYVWNAHATLARKHGVADALIDALRERKPLPDAPADQSAFLRYALELLNDHRVTQATFDAAQGVFGTPNLVELTALIGHYVQNTFLLNAFAVDMPSGVTEPQLPV